MPGVGGWEGLLSTVAEHGSRISTSALHSAWAAEDAVNAAAAAERAAKSPERSPGGAQVKREREDWVAGGALFEDVCRWDDAAVADMPLVPFLHSINLPQFVGNNDHFFYFYFYNFVDLA